MYIVLFWMLLSITSAKLTLFLDIRKQTTRKKYPLEIYTNSKPRQPVNTTVDKHFLQNVTKLPFHLTH